MRMRKIGIFGGSFDPIHIGHLRPVLEILETLTLDEVRFVPAGQPPHRGAPLAPAALRLQMVRAAVRDEPRFLVDERELHRRGPAYTVDTLAELRHEFPRDQLALVVGMDAFLGLPSWHEWRRIFDHAHVIVVHRPGWLPPGTGELADLLRQRSAPSARDMFTEAAGCVLLQPVTQLEISSTQVRTLVAAGGDPRYLVPEAVRKLILDSRCYTQALEH